MGGEKQGRSPQVSRAEGSTEHAGLSKQVASETRTEAQSPSCLEEESAHTVSAWRTVTKQALGRIKDLSVL